MLQALIDGLTDGLQDGKHTLFRTMFVTKRDVQTALDLASFYRKLAELLNHEGAPNITMALERLVGIDPHSQQLLTELVELERKIDAIP